MKTISTIILFFIFFSGSSQELPELKVKTKSIGYFYPQYSYFENDFHVSIPIYNSGLKFNVLNTKKNRGYYFSLSTNFYLDSKVNYSYLGVYRREVLYPSFGMFKSINLSKKIKLSVLSEVNSRLGNETYYLNLSKIYITELTLDNHPLIDFGISIGNEITYDLNSKWFLNANIKETYLLYRFYKKSQSNPVGSTKNVLTFSFGIGFKFKQN